VILAQTIHIGVTGTDWLSVLPELITASGLMLMLLLDGFLRRRAVEITTGIAAAAIVLAGAATWYLFFFHARAANFHGTIASDKFAMYFNFAILLSAILVVLMSPSYMKTSHFDPGEYYALLLGAVTGMMLMAAGTNFMVLFLALELLSLALYILSGFERNRRRSQESGFKYFLLSSFASAFLIYGMALIYGATGTTQLAGINECLRGLNGCHGTAVNSPLLYVGIGLMLVGFAFKVSIVPFHMWTPDVYEGAPTPITAFMSVATKAAVFAAFVRVFNLALSQVEGHWFGVLWVMAVITMIVGNFIALAQTNMKRMLAYSSIAHAGYILVAMSANNTTGLSAVAFYFLAYAFTNVGAFMLVSILESRGEAGDTIADYRGLWYRSPFLAGATAVFMFSLAGFPPTAGFFAKYLAFAAAVKAGHTELAIIGVLTSLISIFYYLRVVVVMFMRTPEREALPGEQDIPVLSDVALSAAVAGTIGLGIIPTGFVSMATQSVQAVRAAFGV
jgi:NADH-quinone oxidoreductase subunit N